MSLSKKMYFIHANGFPSNSYKSLFQKLNTNIKPKYFNINNTKYLNINNWEPFHKDFIGSLDLNNKHIGMGHSIGGNIILRSALSNPTAFSKIILLDPTLFIPRMILMWKIAIIFNMQNILHPWVKATLNRKMFYKDLNSMFKSYRNKKVFKKIDDKNLSIYIDSIITKNNDKSINITYPKKLEYIIYKTGLLADFYIWNNLKNLTVPTLIIRSKSSNAFLKSAAKKISRINNKIKIIEMDDCTHLFPLEKPNETSKYINEFLNKD